MPDVDLLVGQSLPAMAAAVGTYGAGVLTRVEDGAADATVRLGQRLLARVLSRAGDRRARVEAAVADLAAAGDDPDGTAALRFQLRRALAADPELAGQVAAELAASPPRTGSRTVTVHGDASGIVSLGDRATNVQRR
jgi:hypothetical protein